MEDTNQNPSSNPPAGDNWYDTAGIAPEFMTDKIRGFKDINAFAKSFNEGQAFIGKGIPDENTPADIADAFYAKLGRPESADKYSWQPPEGISVAGANAENFKAFKEECFKLGMTDKQVSGVLGRWSNIINDIMAAEQKKYAESIKVSKESLSAPNEWGDKYDDKLNAVLKRIDDMGIRAQLESAGVLYDARVLKAFDAAQVVAADVVGVVDFLEILAFKGRAVVGVDKRVYVGFVGRVGLAEQGFYARQVVLYREFVCRLDVESL